MSDGTVKTLSKERDGTNTWANDLRSGRERAGDPLRSARSMTPSVRDELRIGRCALDKKWDAGAAAFKARERGNLAYCICIHAGFHFVIQRVRGTHRPVASYRADSGNHEIDVTGLNSRRRNVHV